MDSQETMMKLKKPFEASDIEWRVGSTSKDKTKGLALAYVTNRAIQNRLDDVFGCFGWRNEYREWKGNSQLCGISVLHDGEWITKWDGASDSNTEATKGGLSDAMKRAGYQWGIGRYLYDLPDVWVDIEQKGNSYVIKKTPSLPKWALPVGSVNTPTTSEDKPKMNDKPKEVLDSVITEDEFKAIKQGAKAKHGEVDGKECLKDYLTERGYKSFKELKQSKIADVSKYIAEWSDTRLPPDIA
jgi:hypothetical protein